MAFGEKNTTREREKEGLTQRNVKRGITISESDVELKREKETLSNKSNSARGERTSAVSECSREGGGGRLMLGPCEGIRQVTCNTKIGSSCQKEASDEEERWYLSKKRKRERPIVKREGKERNSHSKNWVGGRSF